MWEARSVNGRNLEIRCRLPQGLDRLENPARAKVGGRLKRGNVSLTLTMASEREGPALRVNRAVLAELAALVEQVRTATGAAAPTADGLLRVRGVIEEEDQCRRKRNSGSRGRQGDRGDARGGPRCAGCSPPGRGEGAVGRHRAPYRRDRGPERPRRRSGCVADRHDSQPVRRPARGAAAARSVAVGRALRPGGGAAGRQGRRARGARPARRAYRAARSLLAEARPDHPVGRKFDFLCQEFNREANTLCAKSADIELTRIGIDLKGAIEQLARAGPECRVTSMRRPSSGAV